MAESIIIKLDLDESEVQAAAKRAADTTEKEFQSAGNEIERTVAKSAGLLKDLTTLVGGLASALVVAPPVGKGLFGTISKLGFASAGLLVLSKALEDTESQFGQTAASAARLASLITGGLGAALGFAVLKVSDLAFQFGSKLVSSLQSSRDSANAFISSQNILNKVIENFNTVTGGAVGSTESYQRTIDKLSGSLNLSTKELNKSAQEIVSVGSQLGLTSDQLQKLIKVSAEYAKVNNKDVFPTSLALVKALSGNAQAVQALGIKLNEASVQQFAFKEGITKSLNELSENEVVQLRFNKLLKQYKNITGVAATAASQLGDQENALNVSLEKLNASFGAGVAIVENYNIASKALNVLVGSLNEGVIQTAGFLSALGARFLQVTGFVVNLGFKLFIVGKALKVISTLLDSNVSTTSLLTRKIGILNLSIVDLVSSLTRGKVGLAQLSVAGERARGVFSSLLTPLLAFKKSGALSIFGSLKQLFVVLASSVGRFAILLAPLGLLLAKIAAVVALIVAPFIALGKAIKFVEDRTGAFSTIYQAVLTSFKESATVLQPVIDLYNTFAEAISKLVRQGFGLLIDGVAKVTKGLFELAQSNPFGIFSDNTIAALGATSGRLEKLRSDLKAVAFDTSLLAENGSRDIAALGNSSINLESLIGKLNQLRDALRNVGKTDIQIIQEEQNARLETLRLALENELIQEQEFNELRERVRQDALARIQAIEDKANKERLKQVERAQSRINSIVNQGFTNAISGGIQNIVKSLAKGENVFENFGKFILNTFGELAIQLGQFFIAQGIAALALKTLDPTGTIAAGAGLVALGALLQAFGGGSSGGSQPSFGSSSSDFTNTQFEDEFGTAEPESLERSPRNQIIVQGSIVDPQGILDAVNQVAEENGAVLTGASFA